MKICKFFLYIDIKIFVKKLINFFFYKLITTKMTKKNNVKASLMSGLIEVVATHPLDYTKTLLQNNNKLKSSDIIEYLKTPYKGVSSRIFGVVPMRVIFWNSLEYFKGKGYSSVTSGLLTSITQTFIDYPIEQIKTQQINNNNYNIIKSFKNIKLFEAYSTHLARNMGFAIIFSKTIEQNPDSYYLAAVGGFLGSLITHPFDSLKTWYQTGNKSYPKHWNINNYMKGWNYRCGVSLVSMNIGWVIFRKLSKN